MKLLSRCRTHFGLSLLAASLAVAQERGRTDGPENSEFGKGGYQSGRMNSPFSSSNSRVSLSLLGGASLYAPGPLAGSTSQIPLFAGATVSFWADEWFLVDVSGSYLLNAQRGQLLVGPRFRTLGWRVSGHVGLQAGAMVDGVGLRFGLSPNAGVDVPVSDHWLFGGGAAWDIPIAGGNTAFRLYISTGYRF